MPQKQFEPCHVPKQISLTIGWLQVPVQNGDGGLVVQVVHAPANLHSPVCEHRGADGFPLLQYPAERPSLAVLHHQAQVGLLQTNSLQSNDVHVLQEPEQARFLQDILSSQCHVLLMLYASSLHCHLATTVDATEHLHKNNALNQRWFRAVIWCTTEKQSCC